MVLPHVTNSNKINTLCLDSNQLQKILAKQVSEAVSSSKWDFKCNPALHGFKLALRIEETSHYH